MNYEQEQLFSQIQKTKESDILFWGASLFLENFLNEQDLNEFNILGIIDKDYEKWGKKLSSYQIFSPEKLKHIKHATVIYTVKNGNEKIYKNIENYLQNQYKTIKLMPNIFPSANDKKIEQISSNKLFLINSKGERKQVSYINGLNIKWGGENSIVEFYADKFPEFIEECSIFCRSNCKITIGSHFRCKNLQIRLNNNCKLTIGKGCYFIGVDISNLNEPDTEITIGDDCTFSSGINIKATDEHTIYDNNGKILNKPTKLTIGNHCWFCRDVFILKNTNIPNNTVVGARALVCGTFEEENTVIGGFPAKVLKRNINWDIQSTANFRYNDISSV